MPPWYYPTQIYTALDGLSQTYTYRVIQDSRGYIWVATREGINRFDGRQFENHLTNPIFPDDIIYEIAEDERQDIWFSGEAGVYQYTGDTVLHYRREEVSSEAAKLSIRDRGEPWLYLAGKCYTLRDGRFVEAFELPLDSDIMVHQFRPLEAGGFLFRQVNTTTGRSSLHFLDNQGRMQLISPDDRRSFQNISINPKAGPVYVRIDQSIYRFENGRLEHVVEVEPPFNYFAVKGDRIVVADYFHVYAYESGQWKHYGLDLNYISDLLIDRDDRLWITTEEGLVKVESEALEYYPRERGMLRYPWTILEDSRKNTWFASYHYGLRVLNEAMTYESAARYPGFEAVKNLHFYIGGIKRRNGDLLFPTNYRVIQFNPTTGFSTLKGSPVKGIAYQDIKEHEDTLYLATKGLMIIYPNGASRFYSDEDGLNTQKLNYIEALELDKNGRVWMVSHLGMAMFDGKHFHNYYEGKELSAGLNCLFRDHRENLWFGGHNSLLFYDYTSELPHPVFQDTIQDLNGSIKFISAIDSSYLVLGMLDRLVLLDLHDFYDGRPNYYVMDSENGFEGQDCIQGTGYVNSEGHVWVATRNTVFKLLPEKIRWRNSPASNVVLQSIITQRSGTESKEQRTILIRENPMDYTFFTGTDLQINFGTIDHTNPEKTTFQYRLTGYDPNWSERTTRRFALFANLPPGKYVFEVKACVGNHCTAVRRLPIGIVRERMEAILWVLYRGIPLILGLWVISEVVQRRKVRRRAQKLERQLLNKELEHLKLRQSFLLNQASPHFTFNILNAIAGLVSQEKLLDARRYIGRFGDLFRSMLYDNGKLTRTLEEEIQFVENYLALEKLRFSDRFDYVLEVEKDVPRYAFVPKMSIQTFVNNAVKHGLESIRQGGRLNIFVSRKDSRLEVIVQDNGIGRNRSLRNKGFDERKSGRGIVIMQDTFQWFNDQYPEQSNITLIDLLDEQGRPAGTRVELSIYAHYRNL